MKAKKVFDKYLLSVLIACFMVAVHNFAISVVKAAFTASRTTPVYAKVVDGISTSSNAEERNTTDAIDHKTKSIASTYATRRATTVTRTAASTKITPVNSGNYVTVGGRKIKLTYQEPQGSTLIVPNSHAAYFGKLLYGHNISSVFAHLNSASVGETITVSINGTTKTYRIVKKERKAIGEISMASLIYTRSYAFTMMTCVGNGATHRDIIYLN